MTFLIDGYNLMHAVGLASRSMPARGLHRARERFLDWLADAIRDREDEVCVVFDSKRAASSDGGSDHRGIRVRFSQGQTADEAIEMSIRGHPRPGHLGVVSNDGQVREAGRVRGCRVFRCEEFVDWLIGTKKPVMPATHSPEKAEPEATAEEMAAWLNAFSTPKNKRRRP